MEVLTKQENRVAHLISNGFYGKEIADKLYISPKTVSVHYRNIRRKIHASNIADITREYILSLPKASDVLKTVLFLLIQFNIIFNAPNMDLRRARRVRSSRRKIEYIIK